MKAKHRWDKQETATWKIKDQNPTTSIITLIVNGTARLKGKIQLYVAYMKSTLNKKIQIG